MQICISVVYPCLICHRDFANRTLLLDLLIWNLKFKIDKNKQNYLNLAPLSPSRLIFRNIKGLCIIIIIIHLYSAFSTRFKGAVYKELALKLAANYNLVAENQSNMRSLFAVFRKLLHRRHKAKYPKHDSWSSILWWQDQKNPLWPWSWPWSSPTFGHYCS